MSKRIARVTKPIRMAITKEEIIEAIRTEPLCQNVWAERPLLPDVGKCRVCAVGATLRAMNMPNHLIDAYASIAVTRVRGWMDEALSLIERGHYLDALSVVFEGDHSTQQSPARSRARAIRFVKAHFPEQIHLSASILEIAKTEAQVKALDVAIELGATVDLDDGDRAQLKMWRRHNQPLPNETVNRIVAAVAAFERERLKEDESKRRVRARS